MPEPIEALLFDLGRVLIELDTNRAHARWAELAGVPASRLAELTAARIGGSEFFHAHERGKITDAQFFAHLRQALEIDLSDDQLLEGWNAIFVGEMPGIRPALARAKTRLPLYVFSNTNGAHQACWSARFADMLAPFRKVYVSNEIGARKPDAEAFRLVIADIGMAPNRVLFLDDRPENVAGARACGIVAVEVTSVDEIERALDQYVDIRNA
jgi:putative hydrolase of the HAD superfamily